MNPRDIMTDAIHNFHPQYQQYTQYSSDNRRFQATNPNAATAAPSGDQGNQLSSQQNPVQNSQHQNGVLLKASQKDLESSYSRSLREQGLIDSAMDEALDFEQDFGKSAAQNLPKSGEGSTKGKKTKAGSR